MSMFVYIFTFFTPYERLLILLKFFYLSDSSRWMCVYVRIDLNIGKLKKKHRRALAEKGLNSGNEDVGKCPLKI